MTKEAFLERLGELIACLPEDQVEESKAFYAEAIDDRMEDGMTEEEAVAALGVPGEVAEGILDDLPAVPRAIARTKRKSATLLWVLTILGSPVWISLGIAFAAVVTAVYICVWALALCVWIVAVALCAVGVTAFALVAAGIAIGHFPYVLAMLGSGLALMGAGLLVGAGAWATSQQIARLSALWMRRVFSPFRKDRPGRGCGGARRTQPKEPHDTASTGLGQQGPCLAAATPND